MSRIVIAAFAAEVLGVLCLVLLVLFLGPSDRFAEDAFARRLGLWVGPISGFTFCFLGGHWAARGAASDHIQNGFAVGIVGAAIDIAILLIAGEPFLPIFALSNAGRVLSGTLGGWLASRSA